MSDDSAGPSAPHDNFLYLLAELEATLERGSIIWPPGAAKAAQRRIGRLFMQLDAIITRPSAH